MHMFNFRAFFSCSCKAIVHNLYIHNLYTLFDDEFLYELILEFFWAPFSPLIVTL